MSHFSIETYTFSYNVMRFWIFLKPSVSASLFWHGFGSGRMTVTFLWQVEGSPGFLLSPVDTWGGGWGFFLLVRVEVPMESTWSPWTLQWKWKFWLPLALFWHFSIGMNRGTLQLQSKGASPVCPGSPLTPLSGVLITIWQEGKSWLPFWPSLTSPR